MLEAERHRVILKLTSERSVVSVIDLVEILGASEATVRRDINALAETGQLRRIRGGAEALRPRHEAHLVGVPFQLNESVKAAEKRAIARAAVGLMNDGDSILINGGTTTHALAPFLQEWQLDILTNSIPLMIRLLGTRNRLVMTGGTVFREQNIVLSPYENDGIEHFWGKRLFTGCYGLNRFGMMEADPLIVQAQLKLLKRCEEVIVLADSRKLSQQSAMVSIDLARISTLITDQDATPGQLEPLLKAGIKVIQVDAETDASGESIAQLGSG